MRKEDLSMPIHPGVVLKTTFLEAKNITVTDAAKELCITRKALSELINGHAAVSAEMAIKLSKMFGTPPQMWLVMQMEYDLARARGKMERTEFERIG